MVCLFVRLGTKLLLAVSCLFVYLFGIWACAKTQKEFLIFHDCIVHICICICKYQVRIWCETKKDDCLGATASGDEGSGCDERIEERRLEGEVGGQSRSEVRMF